MGMATTELIAAGLQADCKFMAAGLPCGCAFALPYPLLTTTPSKLLQLGYTQPTCFYGADSPDLFGLCLGQRISLLLLLGNPAPPEML